MRKSEDVEKLGCCQIAVGTPGRLQSLIASGKLAVKNIKLLVLDEADKLMDDIFLPQIRCGFPCSKCLAFGCETGEPEDISPL